MVLFYPETLELESMVKQSPRFIRGFRIDKLYYLLHLVITLKVRERTSSAEFQPISSELLKNLFPDYRRYLDYLIDLKILDFDSYYKPKERCKSYRLKQRYWVDKINHRVSTCISLKNHVIRRNDKHELNFWFNQHFKIDISGAIESLTSKLIKNEIEINSYNAAYVGLISIASRDYRFKIDSTAGRYHTILTSLKSSLRPFLTYEGHKLVSCDISCSQPFFILAILEALVAANKSGAGDAKGVSKSISKQLNIVKGSSKWLRPSMMSSIMWEETLERIDYQSFNSYRNDVVEGQFYDKISTEYTRQFRTTKERNWIKKAVFKVMYGKERNTAVRKIFQSLYPAVLQVLEIIKRKEHRNLAVILQCIEAQLVINVICKEKKLLPIFTIHDCVVTTVGNEEYVKSIMEEEILNFVGSKPTIKVEHW